VGFALSGPDAPRALHSTEFFRCPEVDEWAGALASFHGSNYPIRVIGRPAMRMNTWLTSRK
jgi:hypothetical protein